MRWRRSFLTMAIVSAVTFNPLVGLADDLARLRAATIKISNQGSTATGFVVSRSTDSQDVAVKILVTSAHVFEKAVGNQCKLVLRKPKQDGSYLRQELPVTIRSDHQPKWVRHPKVDVAALALTDIGDTEIPAIAYADLIGKAPIDKGIYSSGDSVWAFCFPAQLEANSAGFPILRRGSIASFPIQPIEKHRTFLVDMSSFGGDSGAPVIVQNRSAKDKVQPQFMVMGLVMGQQRETTKSVTPIEERTVHRSLGLAIAVHSEFIRQTVDQISK